MREELDNTLKLLFEFFVRYFQAVLPQDVVSVRGQNLCKRVLHYLEIHELLETLRSLYLK